MLTILKYWSKLQNEWVTNILSALTNRRGPSEYNFLTSSNVIKGLMSLTSFKVHNTWKVRRITLESLEATISRCAQSATKAPVIRERCISSANLFNIRTIFSVKSFFCLGKHYWMCSATVISDCVRIASNYTLTFTIEHSHFWLLALYFVSTQITSSKNCINRFGDVVTMVTILSYSLFSS